MSRTKKRKVLAKSESGAEPTGEEAEVDCREEDQDERELHDNDDGDAELEESDTVRESSENPQNALFLPDTIPSSPTQTDDIDDSTPEGIKKLLEPLSKDLLCDLLCSAASCHADIRADVVRAADADHVHRKIFVHGLDWETSAEALTAAFSKYGEIEDCNAVRDKISGKSKGYGFILFKHRSGARAALKEPQKKIGSRVTACQLAFLGPVPAVPPQAPPVPDYTQRKIYVSNVSSELDPQKLLEFFRRYGEIEEGPLGLDKQTGKPKGFAFFVFKTSESARKALEEPHKNFEGHILHCQRAIDGPKPNKSFHHMTSTADRGSNFTHNESTSGFLNQSGGVGGQGHMIAPSQTSLPYNHGFSQATAAAAALNPALGHALTALLATQGAGLGLTNLLAMGGMTSNVNPNMPTSILNNAGNGLQSGYGNQGIVNGVGGNVMGDNLGQPGMHPRFPNFPGQGGSRSQQGWVPPYFGQ